MTAKKKEVEIPAMLKKARALPQTPRMAWQFGVKRLRLWVWDDEQDRAERPYSMLVMELYPRGTVITNLLASPVGTYPNSIDALHMLLKQMVDPAEDEKLQRPVQISFIDEKLLEFCREPLVSIGIEVVKLTEATGVEDYITKFSNKLIERGRASRGDAAERPGVHKGVGIQRQALEQYFSASRKLYSSKPWRRIDEVCAIEAEWLKGGEKRYVTVLGSSDRTYGVAVMGSIQALRRKYARASGTYDVEKDIEANMLCGNCGKEPTTETFRCTACRRLFYCDQDCQRANWKQHQYECKDPSKLEHVTREVWNKREQTMVFLDSSAVPFDDLEYAEVNEFWDAQSSKFPLIFVSIQGSPMLPPRVVRPTPEELEWMTMLISALGQT
mmetsp:Transcript_7011/g.30811  ORF Transcript_7011/g.30811 Transcript_7011/m.30811 type:complete len:385 (-) Transcript_7011:4970-6124(-)